jgi:hypothetical protein
LRIANVAVVGVHAVGDICELMQAGIFRCQGKAADLGAQHLQPQGKPTTLEAGVPGDKYPAT